MRLFILLLFIFSSYLSIISFSYARSIPERFINPSKNLSECISSVKDPRQRNISIFVNYCNKYVSSNLDMNYMYYQCIYNEARLGLEKDLKNSKSLAKKTDVGNIITSYIYASDSARCANFAHFYKRGNKDVKDANLDLRRLQIFIGRDLYQKLVVPLQN